jgi:hypothetical protein
MFTRRAHLGYQHPKTAHQTITAIRSPGIGKVYKGLGTTYIKSSLRFSRANEITLPLANAGLPGFYQNPTQIMEPPSVTRENIVPGSMQHIPDPLSVPMRKGEGGKEAEKTGNPQLEKRHTFETGLEIGEPGTGTPKKRKIEVQSVALKHLVPAAGGSLHGGGLNPGINEEKEEKKKKKSGGMGKKVRHNFKIE